MTKRNHKKRMTKRTVRKNIEKMERKKKDGGDEDS